MQKNKALYLLRIYVYGGNAGSQHDILFFYDREIYLEPTL